MGILIPIPRVSPEGCMRIECSGESHQLGPVVKWALVSTVLTTDVRITIIESITSYYYSLLLGKINVQTKCLCDYPYKSTQRRDGYCSTYSRDKQQNAYNKRGHNDNSKRVVSMNNCEWYDSRCPMINCLRLRNQTPFPILSLHPLPMRMHPTNQIWIIIVTWLKKSMLT